MKKITTQTRFLAMAMAGLVLLSSCASTTIIDSEPPGARVYLNGARVGTTPYSMTDTKIVGTCTSVRLEKEGHDELHTFICRNEEVDVGAIVGGVFFWFPFLWTMKYRPVHMYELPPMGDYSDDEVDEYGQKPGIQSSKAERLRELKALYDEGILTQEEYEQEKQEILDED